MNNEFWQVLPFAVVVELVIGPLMTCVVWPLAIRRLHHTEAVFVVGASVPLCIVPPLTIFSLTMWNTPVTIGQAGWWWTISFLPSFLSGTLAYVVRHGIIRRNDQIAQEVLDKAQEE